MKLNVPRIKFTLVFGTLFVWAMVNNYFPANLVFFIIFVLGFLLLSEESNKEWEDEITHGDAGQRILCYYGDELHFPEDIIISCLTKHLPYYSKLNPPDKEKFRERLSGFIRTKTFKIHDTTGFREMPILVSASAIQLSFGLDSYLLPQFEYIHIFPEEFVHTGSSSSHFLEGNVSGESINISWKHFLEGFQFPEDGQNVGLHEMAHAYYWQNFISGENTDNRFVSTFPTFNHTANKVFELEKAPGNDLYSEYALTNFQEFWAESIEIFFEKPVYMHNAYPDLYEALCKLLNQDPMNKLTSLHGQ